MAAPDKSVVEIIENVLERAKQGEITGVAIATCHADLSTASAWSMEAATLAELLGSVAMLNYRLLKEMDGGPG